MTVVDLVSGKRVAWWILILAIGVSVFRLSFAGHSLWFDEQASLFFADQSLSNLWGDWMLRETNPPLFYTLLKFWAGESLHSNMFYRVPSIVIGGLCIYASYVLAQHIFDWKTAVCAAGLTSLSGQQLFYSEQVRAYALLYLAGMFTILAAYKIARDLEHWSPLWLGMLIASSTLMIYSHTTAILAPLVVFLAVAGSRLADCVRRPMLLLPLLISTIIIYMLSAWCIRIAILQAFQAQQNIASIGLSTWAHALKESFLALFLAARKGVIANAARSIILILACVGAWRFRSRPGVRAIVLVGGLWLLVLGTLAHWVPVFAGRTIVWVSIVPLLLASAALTGLQPLKVRVAVCLVLGALLTFDCFKVLVNLEAERWDQAIRAVAQDHDAVLLVQGEAMGLLANQDCERLYAGTCPFKVIAITSASDTWDSWANGLFQGQQVPIQMIRTLPQDKNIYLFRKNFAHDLVYLLHDHGMAQGIARLSPPFVGPVSYGELIGGS